MQSTSSFWRDANHVPITNNGVMVEDSITFSGNGTIHVPLFTITGTVEIIALYGIVTTALGSNHTAAYFRLQDQTAQPDITLNTGTTMSSASNGSLIVKKDLATAAVTLSNASAGRVTEPTTFETSYFSPFVVVQKTGSIKTEIEYVYSTNNSSAGAIKFYCGFVPISTDGDVAVSTTAAY